MTRCPGGALEEDALMVYWSLTPFAELVLCIMLLCFYPPGSLEEETVFPYFSSVYPHYFSSVYPKLRLPTQAPHRRAFQHLIYQ